MNKKNKKTAAHLMLGGLAHYDVEENVTAFMFTPDDAVMERLTSFNCQGTGQLLSDGTFEFTRKARQKSQAVKIRKLAHGCLSKTKDEAILLTIKVFCDENVNISETIRKESNEAVRALKDYLLTR